MIGNQFLEVPFIERMVVMSEKRIISLIILSSILASLMSCGDKTMNGTDTAGSDQTSSDITSAEPDYVFPELDCGKDTFTILNAESIWKMYTYLDFEQQTGDQLDDVIYNRNRKIEELFNVKLDVINVPLDSLAKTTRQSVMANDSAYDAAYIKGEHIAPLITEELLIDLTTAPDIQLDKDWWNQNVLESARIGKNNSVFFAVSDLSLAAFDMTFCFMFNENMLEKLGLDKPYNLVRDGKWTIDELKKYAAAGANLNGDEDFKENTSGSSIYGIASYHNIVGEMIIGAGCRFTDMIDGELSFALDNERFYNVCEKIASITSVEGDYIDANSAAFHYEQLFKAGRALFTGAELKASAVFRDFDDTFGIVPAPKLDETQSGYYSWINFMIPLLTIPKDCIDVRRACIILDALSYLSARDVLPTYYDITVSQKGLRNEESIEMLGIIRDTRYFDASLAYGWTLKFYYNLREKLSKEGNPNTASSVAKNKDAINALIEATLDLVNAE